MTGLNLSFSELCILLEKCSNLNIKEFELGGLKIRLDGKIQETPAPRVVVSIAPDDETISERAGTEEKYINKEPTDEELNLLSVEDPAAYEEYIMGKVQDGDARDFEEE